MEFLRNLRSSWHPPAPPLPPILVDVNSMVVIDELLLFEFLVDAVLVRRVSLLLDFYLEQFAEHGVVLGKLLNQRLLFRVLQVAVPDSGALDRNEI